MTDDGLDDAPMGERPARQPWFTAVVVGVVMLAAGVLLGYFGRGEFGPEAVAARATATVAAAAVKTQAAGNQQLMEFLVKQVRHWRGSEDAKVTLIEFSDYQ